MVDTTLFFLLSGGVIFAGFFASLLFERYRVPDIILLMLLGLLIGPVFHVVGAATLESVKGNRNEAARILGINRTTLYKKMHKFGLINNYRHNAK